MRDFEIQGAVFDVDDTLLDNEPGVHGLHERSRLAATYEVGRRHDIPELLSLTPEENYEAFMSASVHTFEASVWQMLVMKGLVGEGPIDPSHQLLVEITKRKNELHQITLQEYAQEIPGASEFVRRLSKTVDASRLAIASTGIRPDIDVFLAKVGLTDIFEHRIVSFESITHPKPHPEGFNKAFDHLGLPNDARGQVIAVEDDPRGIMAARAAGLFVCGITTRYSRADMVDLEIPPHLVVDSYEELTETLAV